MSTTSKVKIPVVNLTDYTHGTPEQKAAFIKTWGEGLKEFGFVAVEGHHLDRDLIKKNYAHFKQFFSLPRPVKDQYGGVAGGARGYTAFGTEHAKDAKVGDLKEFWHTGRELPDLRPTTGKPCWVINF